jgi:hypothetical protein
MTGLKWVKENRGSMERSAVRCGEVTCMD